MIEQIAKIYENIYNQELRNRESLDNKFSSRFTILIAIATAYVILLSTLFDKLCDNNCLNYDFLNTLFLILCSLFSITTLLSIVFFYKCFFRLKKNYMVMPTSEIRINFAHFRTQIQTVFERNILYILIIQRLCLLSLLLVHILF